MVKFLIFVSAFSFLFIILFSQALMQTDLLIKKEIPKEKHNIDVFKYFVIERSIFVLCTIFFTVTFIASAYLIYKLTH